MIDAIQQEREKEVSTMFDFNFTASSGSNVAGPSMWAPSTHSSQVDTASYSVFGGGFPTPHAFSDVTNQSGHSSGAQKALPVAARDDDGHGTLQSLSEELLRLSEGCGTVASDAHLFDGQPLPSSRAGVASISSGSDMMLVKGEFLCASKLLQLAASHPLPHTRSASTATCDLDSPSRVSTPMSVANAVLFGTDDSPEARAPSHRSDDVLLAREYSTFSVSAGGPSSRGATPTSPTSGTALGSTFTTKLFPNRSNHGSQHQSHHHTGSPYAQVFSSGSRASLQGITSSASPMASAGFNGRRGTTPVTPSTPSDTQTPTASVGGAGGVDVSARRAARSHHVPTVVPVQKPIIMELTEAQTCVVVLEFKMGRKLRCRCSLDLIPGASPVTVNPVGQYFVVSVDNNGLEDCGVCTAVVPMADRHTLHRTFGHSDQGTIIRMANSADCSIINDILPQMEEDALGRCHELIHFLHLPFVCVDAEYTFDQKGCKLFYSLAPQTCTSIIPNVSRLQRELGYRLKCRVVLEQVRSGTTGN